jgi:DNA-binding NarL/FixJ family response regulator
VIAQTVLLVDDHAGFRATARRMLERDGWTVVGEAGDGASAVAAVAALQPDVVLLDIGLPDLDGFGVAEQLDAAGGTPLVVLISSRDRDDYASRIAASPAHGFLAKADLSGPGLRAIVAGGGSR